MVMRVALRSEARKTQNCAKLKGAFGKLVLGEDIHVNEVVGVAFMAMVRQFMGWRMGEVTLRSWESVVG